MYTIYMAQYKANASCNLQAPTVFQLLVTRARKVHIFPTPENIYIVTLTNVISHYSSERPDK